MRIVTLATCALNQFALDFVGNLERIKLAVQQAREQGASYLLTPELSLCGYGCEDHFLEQDTIAHSVECLAKLLQAGCSDGMLLDVGLPLLHRSVRYNCRALLLNGRVLLIRPKIFLANDLNYREGRWFGAWSRMRQVDEFVLPPELREVTGQHTVPFGDGVLQTRDSLIGSESCEELFTPDSPHIHMALDGVEIFTNGSGSHHELRKLHRRVELLTEATKKCGGVYLYSNQQGCDGGRLYFDGCASIIVNGKLLAQGTQFSLADVEVISATVNLDAVTSYRAATVSTMAQASTVPLYPRTAIDVVLTRDPLHTRLSAPREPRYHLPEEEIALGPACWLWDYLRRSKMRGYFLPLSGGMDSSSTATIVGVMCHLVVDAVRAGDAQALADVRAIVRQADYAPTDARELASRLFYTCYMGTSNSSAATRARARALAGEIGSFHMDVDIDPLVSAMLTFFTDCTKATPRFKVHGGTTGENLALQNIQARLRMVLSYLFGQLLPWVRHESGSLLILGSANVDEALRGFYTKYDCSAADVNPIGSICKLDLRRFLAWAGLQAQYGYSSLLEVVTAEPTPELEPILPGHVQTSTEDMGMTFEELATYGKLRKQNRLGPHLMFRELLTRWPHLPPRTIADKVKYFFDMYARNRHKTTTLTPSYHAESYSPDDNRFDHRQFLYPAWTHQFSCIDEDVARLEAAGEATAGRKRPAAAVPSSEPAAKRFKIASQL